MTIKTIYFILLATLEFPVDRETKSSFVHIEETAQDSLLFKPFAVLRAGCIAVMSKLTESVVGEAVVVITEG